MEKISMYKIRVSVHYSEKLANFVFKMYYFGIKIG